VATKLLLGAPGFGSIKMVMAFLKRSHRSKNGSVYESWAIVESVRTAKGPQHRTIATLGKAPEYDAEERVGREDVIAQLPRRHSDR